MLKIVTGRIASGKTHRIIEDIGQRINNRQKSILIVPDPVTYNFEQRLCRQLNINGFIDVEVSSFNRLASSVLDFFGKRKTYLDDCSKAMAVRIALIENADKLTIFRSAAKRKGFSARCLNMVSTIENCGYSYDDLISCANKLEDGVLKYKLNDMAVIFKAYSDILQSGYTDNADKLKTAGELLKFYPSLKDTVVYIDGFDVLTSHLVNFISALINSTDVVIALSSAENGKDRKAYEIHEKTLNTIIAVAKENGIEYKIESVSRNVKYKSEEIHFLEDNFYSFFPETFEKPVNNVDLLVYPTIETEISDIAKRIIDGVKKGNRYRDYAVISNDVKKYSPIVNNIFKRYNIPVYTDEAHDITAHPVAAYLFSLLKCAYIGFTPENVTTLLLSSLTPALPDERDSFIYFIKELGVNTWEIEKGLAYKRANEEKQQEFELLRKKIITPFIEYRENILNVSTAREMAEITYKFMEKQGVYENICALVDRYEALELFSLSDVTSQLWNKILELMERLSDLSGEKKIPLSEFSETLFEGFRATPLSTIPSVLDSVTFGDLSATKEQNVKNVFIVGANDGVIPAIYTDEKLVTATENAVLKEYGMELAHSQETEDARIRYTIYSALCSPVEHLYISCPLRSLTGGGLELSTIFEDFKKLFKNIEKKNVKELPADKELLEPYTKNQAMLLMAQDKFNSPQAKALLEYFEDDSDRLFSILKNEASQKEQTLPKELAKDLFLSRQTTSISRLETYANCPFKHFIEHGLDPEELREYSADSIDVGTLIHNVIETFTKENSKLDLTRDQCYQKAAEIFDKKLPDVHFGALLSTERQKTVNKLLKNFACESAWQVRQHMDNFTVLGQEIVFGRNGLPPIEIETDSGTLYLEGKIDRVDRLDKDGNVYIRIIDYKTGKSTFSPDDVESGKDLQLAIYMRAILSNFKNGVPASMQYMRLTDNTFSGAELVDFNEKGLPRSAFNALLDSAVENAKKFSEEILEGNIKTNADDCKYCSYSMICGKKQMEETNNA